MRKIESNARHLLGLINDVLDLSKVESGKMEVYAEAFDDRRHGGGGRRRGAEPRRQEAQPARTSGSTPGLGAMESDLTKIRQILLNLLSNAAKFTEGGTITLAAARQRGRRPTGWSSRCRTPASA